MPAPNQLLKISSIISFVVVCW